MTNKIAMPVFSLGLAASIHNTTKENNMRYRIKETGPKGARQFMPQEKYLWAWFNLSLHPFPTLEEADQYIKTWTRDQTKIHER